MSGHVLVVDDVPTNRVLLRAKLSAGYYDVTDAEDGEQAIEIAQKTAPDMILLDVMLPGIDGYEVCRRLKSDPDTAHIPVVMITALNSPDEKVRGLEAGADDFLAKPINDLALFARVKALIRMKIMIDELRLRSETTRELGLLEADMEEKQRAAETGNILILAPDAFHASAWQGVIRSRLGLDSTAVLAADEVLASFTKPGSTPDLIVISQTIAGHDDGIKLVSAVRARSDLRSASILFVADSEKDIATAALALDMGASDYITLPCDHDELVARVRAQLRRKKYSDGLRSNVLDGLKMAAIDPLTELYNRRYALQHLRKLLERSRNANCAMTVLMLDLDEFKSVNDSHGHAVGDLVLREFAQRLRQNVRGVDLVARLGGEEFCIGMPEQSTENAVEIAERVRNVMEQEPFDVGDGLAPIKVTVSVGVATAMPGDSYAIEALLKNADVALYQAKASGRNMVRTSCVAA